MATLYLDIQTIPSQQAQLIAQIRHSLKPPANYSQPDSIAKWYQQQLPAAAAKKHRQTALDGLYGEIFSIAWAIDDGAVMAFWRDDQASERSLLEQFMLELAEVSDSQGRRLPIRRWVGHYISGFDLRFLWQRCVICRVRPSLALPLDAGLWDDRVFDTSRMWNGDSNGQSSLAALAQGLALAEQPGLDGSQIYDLWLAGRYDEIAAYNRQAVSLSRALYKRMLFKD